MSLYSINYDLRNPGRNYKDLHDAIRSYGYWAHPLESMWVVKTSKSVSEVRDHLLKFIDTNDGLIVAGLSGAAAWYGIGDDVSKWLKEQLATAAF